MPLTASMKTLSIIICSTLSAASAFAASSNVFAGVAVFFALLGICTACERRG